MIHYVTPLKNYCNNENIDQSSSCTLRSSSQRLLATPKAPLKTSAENSSSIKTMEYYSAQHKDLSSNSIDIFKKHLKNYQKNLTERLLVLIIIELISLSPKCIVLYSIKLTASSVNFPIY